MSILFQDLRHGCRTLLRAPGFTAVVVLVLALGIGANSAIFSVVNAVLLRPLPYSNPDRLFRLNETNPKGDAMGVSAADLSVFEKNTWVLDHWAISRFHNATLTGPEGPENVFGGRVSS